MVTQSLGEFLLIFLWALAFTILSGTLATNSRSYATRFVRYNHDWWESSRWPRSTSKNPWAGDGAELGTRLVGGGGVLLGAFVIVIELWALFTGQVA